MYAHTYRTQYTTANADTENVCLAMFQHHQINVHVVKTIDSLFRNTAHLPVTQSIQMSYLVCTPECNDPQASHCPLYISSNTILGTYYSLTV